MNRMRKKYCVKVNFRVRRAIRLLLISVISICWMTNVFTSTSKGIVQTRNDVDDGDIAVIKDDIRHNDEQQAAVESRREKNNATAATIQETICKEAPDDDWGKLCAGGFAMAAAKQLLDGEDVNIVQIGAHVGFEQNDPLGRGIINLLDELTTAIIVVDDESDDNKIQQTLRKRFHWTFVEPSPPNFHRLVQKLSSNHSGAICDMKGINAAVVSDSLPTDRIGNNMPFYSLLDTIDPETGYDSLSGKTLPYWITQVSSFSLKPLQRNQRVFRKIGLDLKDYIVVTNVTALPFTKLMQQVLHNTVRERNNKIRNNATSAMNDEKPPLLVLIDTEGFDCDIIKGISPSSNAIPQYLVFEHKNCDYKGGGASEHLENKLGFDLYPPSVENIVAVKKSN